MRSLLVYTFAALCFVSGSIGKEGFGPGEQEWGYVEVRPSANMFWWLYYTTANVKSFYEKPLVIWLQGGLGASSTSFGNFEELGPLDVNLKPRNYTWVNDYNVLFIDSPVGVGFSYVKGKEFAKTNEQIGKDLVECMKGFYEKLPKFQNVSAYITTEWYGGKMGAEFALAWDRAQKVGAIKSNLKGIALGDAWISPIDSVLTWAPFLLNTGMIDTEGFEAIDRYARRTKDAIEAGQWKRATWLWVHTENMVTNKTLNADFYNILTKIRYTRNLQDVIFSKDNFQRGNPLKKLMDGPVKNMLDLKVTHGTQCDKVFNFLMEDFMKPVVHIVERLLNETNLKVLVYNGHMDLIVDTPGTLLWVEKLRWKDADTWKNCIRHPLVADGIVEGYFKAWNNFGMYWVNRAGHMVPKDNPAAQKVILQHLIRGKNEDMNKSCKSLL